MNCIVSTSVYIITSHGDWPCQDWRKGAIKTYFPTCVNTAFESQDGLLDEPHVRLGEGGHVDVSSHKQRIGRFNSSYHFQDASPFRAIKTYSYFSMSRVSNS